MSIDTISILWVWYIHLTIKTITQKLEQLGELTRAHSLSTTEDGYNKFQASRATSQGPVKRL